MKESKGELRLKSVERKSLRNNKVTSPKMLLSVITIMAIRYLKALPQNTMNLQNATRSDIP